VSTLGQPAAARKCWNDQRLPEHSLNIRRVRAHVVLVGREDFIMLPDAAGRQQRRGDDAPAQGKNAQRAQTTEDSTCAPLCAAVSSPRLIGRDTGGALRAARRRRKPVRSLASPGAAPQGRRWTRFAPPARPACTRLGGPGRDELMVLHAPGSPLHGTT
jgi:hypothetical protein